MINSDYHIHTSFCNHASGSMEEFALQAVKMNFKEILFLDHLTLFEENFKNSMTIKEVPLYLYSIKRLEEKFKDKISIKCGLEVDFHPDFFSETEEICNKFDFDMIGASVHFVNGFNIASRKAQKSYSHIAKKDLIEAYFNAMDQMLDYNFFDSICHFDLIFKFFKNKDLKIFNDFKIKITSILEKIAEKNLCMEINTGGFSHPLKRQYPDVFILEQCLKMGIKTIPGSDAHKPEQIGRNFNDAEEILKRAGFSKITRFKKREYYEETI